MWFYVMDKGVVFGSSGVRSTFPLPVHKNRKQRKFVVMSMSSCGAKTKIQKGLFAKPHCLLANATGIFVVF